LFQDIHKARKTGTAVFEQGTESVKVFLDRGTSYSPHQIQTTTQWANCCYGGKNHKEQLDKATKIMARTGKRLGAVLFELGFSHRRTGDQVKLLARKNILALFSRREGVSL